MPVTARGQAQLDMIERLRKVNGDIPSRAKRCMLEGWPAGPTGPEEYSEEFVFTPGQVTMVPNNSQVRRYYTDGRPVPKKLELSFNGFSTAHWEGDTLVAETVGLRPDIQMFYGMPSGDNLRLVERIRTIAPNKTEFAVTQYSDVALTKPWSYRRTFTRHRDWDMLEDYCAQNNRDVGTDTGMQIFDLTPPPEISDGN